MKPFLFVLSVSYFLLMQPVQEAFLKNDFTSLRSCTTYKVSVNFEKPLDLIGYYRAPEFFSALEDRTENFNFRNLRWTSRHIEERFAIQSLNLDLVDQIYNKNYKYKIILFLIKKEGKWKLYSLKGIRLD